MGKLDNIFKKIADATATGGGNNIRDGIYKFLVEKCHIQEGHTGTCLIVEFRVMESTASGAVDEKGVPVAPNPVGSTCSMVCNVTKHESAYGNVKAFVQAALMGLGYQANQITNDVIQQVFEGDPMALRGCQIIDETYRGINKGRANAANAGKPLTLNKWKSVAQTEEDMAKWRAYLDDNASKPEVVAAPVATPTASAAAETVTQTQAPAKSGGLLGALKR
jgi:hypothetical protein